MNRVNERKKEIYIARLKAYKCMLNLPDSTTTACHVRDLLRVLYVAAKLCDSLMSARQSAFRYGRRPHLFHQICDPNNQIRTK